MNLGPRSNECYIKLAQSTSQYYFVLQSLHKVRPSTTSYYKARTKYVPVLLRTTKLAQSTSQYYFVLQSSHKVRPSTTSYYKACTKYVPVRTSYYKARTKYVPVLLRTTKLAQSTSQYVPVLLRTTKLAQSTSSYYKACSEYPSNRGFLGVIQGCCNRGFLGQGPCLSMSGVGLSSKDFTRQPWVAGGQEGLHQFIFRHVISKKLTPPTRTPGNPGLPGEIFG